MTIPENRRFWLFVQQRGDCYLQITRDCRAGGGEMRCTEVSKQHHPRFATFEHLIAKGHAVPDGVSRDECLLLACRECNNLKGGQAMATPAQIAFAMTLARIWNRINAGHLNHAMAFSRCDVPYVTIEDDEGGLLPVIDAPLPIGVPFSGSAGWVMRDGVREECGFDPLANFEVWLKQKRSEAGKPKKKKKRKGSARTPKIIAPRESLLDITAALEDDIGKAELKRAKRDQLREAGVMVMAPTRKGRADQLGVKAEDYRPERKIDRTLHPHLPAAGYDKPMSQRLREQREAEARGTAKAQAQLAQLKKPGGPGA